jgi:DHA1 family inner membrane transport protein
MVMEKAAAAPSLASSANQAAFNLANAGGAWIGGLTLAAGLGPTSPALAGAALAVLGVGVASVAYAVDRRREVTSPGRVIATHVPEQSGALRR